MSSIGGGGVNSTRGNLLGTGLISSGDMGEMGGGGEELGGGGLVTMSSPALSDAGGGLPWVGTATGVVAGGEPANGDKATGVAVFPGDKSVMATTLAGKVGEALGDEIKEVAKEFSGGEDAGVGGEGGVGEGARRGSEEEELSVCCASSGGGAIGGGGRLYCRYILCRLVLGVSWPCVGSENGLSLLAWGLFIVGSEPTRWSRLDCSASARAW